MFLYVTNGKGKEKGLRFSRNAFSHKTVLVEH